MDFTFPSRPQLRLNSLHPPPRTMALDLTFNLPASVHTHRARQPQVSLIEACLIFQIHRCPHSIVPSLLAGKLNICIDLHSILYSVKMTCIKSMKRKRKKMVVVSPTNSFLHLSKTEGSAKRHSLFSRGWGENRRATCALYRHINRD